jgi:DNA polymerase/3'-5' exonuclease PolX
MDLLQEFKSRFTTWESLNACYSQSKSSENPFGKEELKTLAESLGIKVLTKYNKQQICEHIFNKLQQPSEEVSITETTTTSEPSIQETESTNSHPDLPVYEEIDLLKDKNFDKEGFNEQLVAVFNLLLKQIEYQQRETKNPKEKKAHGYRYTNISNAIDIFETYPEKITSGKYMQKNVEGIGKGIADRIDEILETGTLKELTEKQYVSDLTKTIKDLTTVTGIGDKKAQDLINKFGVKSVEDLKQRVESGEIKVAKNAITHHILVGLKYYDDLMQKIPRSEIDKINDLLQKTKDQVDPNLLLEICGSYRRGRPVSSDIDVLLTHPNYKTEESLQFAPLFLSMLIKLLKEKNFIIESLTSEGHTKYMGVCKIDKIARRIDIRFINYDSYIPSKVYFTGSKQFNKIMRGIANKRKYTLNEYGLYHFENRIKGEKIPVYSEKDLFKVIGIKYLTPKERDF